MFAADCRQRHDDDDGDGALRLNSNRVIYILTRTHKPTHTH